MLPARFTLHRPESLDAALALLAEHGDDACAYAGGTEILVAMKARVVRYAHIVDLKRVPELRGIAAGADGALSIGALSTHFELARDPLVRERLPVYAELSDSIANIRVRAAGTLGGNLCFAEPHADPPTLLCALGARAVLASPDGTRTVPVSEFVQGEFTTALEPGELLVRVEVPPLPEGALAGYRSYGHLERPAAGAAVVARPEAQGYAWALWVGAVSGCPVRLEALEAALRGLSPEDAVAALAEQAGEATGALEAMDDVHGAADYKCHLAAVMLRRAAEACMEVVA